MKLKKLFISLYLVFFLYPALRAQQNAPSNPPTEEKKGFNNWSPDIRINLSEDGDKYMKFTFLNQTWLRFNQSNPGTLVQGKAQDNTFDIGLRRTRIQMFGKVAPRTFVYFQFGMNNFNFLNANAGNRKLSSFFHDAVCELEAAKWMKIGGGLTIANGLSRFSQPSIGTILTMDVPVFAQTTVDQTDEFSRKLSVYARGQIWKLDYRFSFSDPFPITTNGVAQPPISANATFAQKGHSFQYQGYLAYNFFEMEPHTTPYMAGSYLGRKKVWNIGAGAIFQPNASWRTQTDAAGVADTVYDNLFHWSVESFLELPLNPEKHSMVSAYAGFFSLNYGQNYIRNNGIMNPANGVVASQASFGGAGNAYPMFGTGYVVYMQAGYKFKDDWLGKLGTLQPYASAMIANYKRLDGLMDVYNLGVNWLLNGHTSKISLNWEFRPTFNAASLKPDGRRSCVVIQYQISI